MKLSNKIGTRVPCRRRSCADQETYK